MTTESEKDKKSVAEKRAGWYTIAAFGFLGFMIVILLLDGYRTDDWAQRGSRGDFWGGHIAAGASVAGTLLFFAALTLQRVELEQQRTELSAMREVHEKQHELADQQALFSRIEKVARYRDELYARYQDRQMTLRDQLGNESANAAITSLKSTTRSAASSGQEISDTDHELNIQALRELCGEKSPVVEATMRDMAAARLRVHYANRECLRAISEVESEGDRRRLESVFAFLSDDW